MLRSPRISPGDADYYLVGPCIFSNSTADVPAARKALCEVQGFM